MKLLRLMPVIIATATIGCSATKPPAPYATANRDRQEVACYLIDNPKMTPWLLESHLHAKGIHYELTQDSWNGMDHWKTGGIGSWTATYTGMNQRPRNGNLVIPGGADFAMDENEPQNASRHVYYDTLTDHHAGITFIFNRNRNLTTMRSLTPNRE